MDISKIEEPYKTILLNSLTDWEREVIEGLYLRYNKGGRCYVKMSSKKAKLEVNNFNEFYKNNLMEA